MKNKTKEWRKQPCPRSDDGRKRKGVNRKIKNIQAANRITYAGVPPLLHALFRRAGILPEATVVVADPILGGINE